MRFQIPDDKKSILEEFCKRNGVTFGAYVEAFCDLLAEAEGDDGEALTGSFPEVLARARDITVARRRRKG